MTPGRLNGRRVLVTGAASGIGSAICRRLSEDGAEVVESDIAEAPGILSCDVGDRAAVDDLLNRAGPVWAVASAAAYLL